MGSDVQHVSERARSNESHSAVSTIVMGRPLGVEVHCEVDRGQRDLGPPKHPGIAVVESLPRAVGEEG